MTVDSTYMFEKRRQVPLKYDRELWANTLMAMKRVGEIREKREQQHIKNRCASVCVVCILSSHTAAASAFAGGSTSLCSLRCVVHTQAACAVDVRMLQRAAWDLRRTTRARTRHFAHANFLSDSPAQTQAEQEAGIREGPQGGGQGHRPHCGACCAVREAPEAVGQAEEDRHRGDGLLIWVGWVIQYLANYYSYILARLRTSVGLGCDRGRLVFPQLSHAAYVHSSKHDHDCDDGSLTDTAPCGTDDRWVGGGEVQISAAPAHECCCGVIVESKAPTRGPVFKVMAQGTLLWPQLWAGYAPVWHLLVVETLAPA